MRKLISIATTIILTTIIMFSTTRCIGEKRVAYNVPADYVLFIQARPQYSMLEEENIVRDTDGTLVLNLTEEEVDQFIVEMRQDADKLIDDIVNSENKIETIKDITYNEDFSEVTVHVDVENALGIEDVIGLLIANYSVEEQVIFGGVPYEEVKVNIKTVDAATGEVISEQQYLDLKAKYYN